MHQERVSALAVGGQLDELARDALPGRELTAAHPERYRRVCLQRADLDLLEPAPVRLGPGQVLAGQKAAAGREQRYQRRPPAPAPSS